MGYIAKATDQGYQGRAGRWQGKLGMFPDRLTQPLPEPVRGRRIRFGRRLSRSRLRDSENLNRPKIVFRFR